MALALGIDLGTSKVAAVIYDSENQSVLCSASHDTFANLNKNSLRAEQDVIRILDTTSEALAALDQELLEQISVVGITGQMHGILLWKGEGDLTTPLFSWQDQRASEFEFLKNLRKKTGDSELQDGYGWVTLAWLQAHEPSTVARFDRASSIMDYFAAMLCGDRESVTEPTIAQSFGLFDLFSRGWDSERLVWGEIPESFIPKLQKSRTLRGVTSEKNRFKLKAGIPVAMPIGDNQASLVASLEDETRDISINLGTAGQLSVVLGEDASLVYPLPAGLELRPYPDGRIAAVCASLCGGKAAEWLCETLINWCRELGGGALDSREVYRKLNDLGLASIDDSSLEVESNFMGERHSPTKRGAVKNIDLNNFTIGNLYAGLVRDVVENLKEMMPDSFLAGRTRIVGSGNGIRKVPLVQKTIERVFGLPLHIKEGVEEAACGAAIHALESINSK